MFRNFKEPEVEQYQSRVEILSKQDMYAMNMKKKTMYLFFLLLFKFKSTSITLKSQNINSQLKNYSYIIKTCHHYRNCSKSGKSSI